MKNIIIYLLSFLLALSVSYIVYTSLQSNEVSQIELMAQVSELNGEYDYIKKNLDNTQFVFNDSLKSYKIEIERLLNKDKINQEEIKIVRKLIKNINQITISSLQSKIKDLESKKGVITNNLTVVNKQIKIKEDTIKIIKKKNTELKTEIVKTKEKRDLYKEKASTLVSSNYILKGFKVRDSGKEIETDKATRIDRVKLSFDILENEIVTSSKQKFYVIFYDSQGQILNFEKSPKGTFKLSNGKISSYTDYVTIEYKNDTINPINFTWDSEEFSKGDYTVEVFNEKGQKIGRSVRSLR